MVLLGAGRTLMSQVPLRMYLEEVLVGLAPLVVATRSARLGA